MALATNPDGSPSTYPRLKRVLIQPRGRPLPGGRCGNPYIAYGRFTVALGAFCEESPFPIERVAELPRTNIGEGKWEQMVKEEWLDRLQGGPGCWVDVAS